MMNYGSLRRAGPDSPRLRTERINKGIYEYSYEGRMVEVKYQPRDVEDGVWPMWFTVINGEYDMDYNTKREARARALEILGYQQ